MLFQRAMMVSLSPPRPGWRPVIRVAKLSKNCLTEDYAWAHSCSSRDHLLTLRTPRWAREHRLEGAVLVFVGYAQLTKAEK